MIPPVVASERGTAQTADVARRLRGCRTAALYCDGEWKYLEHSGILSNAGHEESCANLPGPSGKAKYSRETDSVRVL